MNLHTREGLLRPDLRGKDGSGWPRVAITNRFMEGEEKGEAQEEEKDENDEDDGIHVEGHDDNEMQKQFR